jgi:hypothetical protein
MKAEELFKKYCDENGMDKDDVRAASWYEAGMIDYTDWLLSQLGQQAPEPVEEELFTDFISDIERMRVLYDRDKMYSAEKLRDDLAERLDDIMRLKPKQS